MNDIFDYDVFVRGLLLSNEFSGKDFYLQGSHAGGEDFDYTSYLWYHADSNTLTMNADNFSGGGHIHLNLDDTNGNGSFDLTYGGSFLLQGQNILISEDAGHAVVSYIADLETGGGLDQFRIGTGISLGAHFVLAAGSDPSIALFRTQGELTSGTKCILAFSTEIDGYPAVNNGWAAIVVENQDTNTAGRNDMIFKTNSGTTQTDQFRLRYDGKHQIFNLPTSSAGLPSGSIWKDTGAGNVLKVV